MRALKFGEEKAHKKEMICNLLINTCKPNISLLSGITMNKVWITVGIQNYRTNMMDKDNTIFSPQLA